jgi:hypothetical protein
MRLLHPGFDPCPHRRPQENHQPTTARRSIGSNDSCQAVTSPEASHREGRLEARSAGKDLSVLEITVDTAQPLRRRRALPADIAAAQAL